MSKIYSKDEIKKLTKRIERITFMKPDSDKIQKEKFKQICIDDEYIPYLISSCGRVFSINYKHKKNSCIQLKTTIDKDGYELIIINYNGKSYGFGIHRMVANMFIKNTNPCKTQVNHKNGDKLCNFIYNLEWTTPKENINHAWETGLNKSYGEKNGNNIYKEKDIEKVCELIENNTSFNEISEITGVSIAMISLIYRKKFWTNTSDNYDFSNYNYGKPSNDATIIKICELLENTDESVPNIAKICGVKKSKVYDILRGHSHYNTACKYDFTKRKK